jgi:hypothetical protein
MDNFEQNIIKMIVESFFLVKMPHRLGNDVNFGARGCRLRQWSSLSTIMLSQGMEIYPRDHPSSRKEIKSIFIDYYKYIFLLPARVSTKETPNRPTSIVRKTIERTRPFLHEDEDFHTKVS